MKKIVYSLLISFTVLIVFTVLVVLFFLFVKHNPRAWEKITVTTCSLRGGSMIESGCGIARCTYKCAVSYRDGGKACTNSTQCSHRCITDDARLPSPFSERGSQKQIEQGSAKLKQCTRTAEDTYDCNAMKLSGACEQREPQNCEFRWEVNNGIISPIFVDCTL